MKEKLIMSYPLTKKMDCVYECYEVEKRRYVVFCDQSINKSNIESFLDVLSSATKEGFSPCKSLIVVGYTDEKFDSSDLLYFNGVDTFVVFYLKNIKNSEIYFNDRRVFFFSVDWKHIIKKFNEIVK